MIDASRTEKLAIALLCVLFHPSDVESCTLRTRAVSATLVMVVFEGTKFGILNFSLPDMHDTP